MATVVRHRACGAQVGWLPIGVYSIRFGTFMRMDGKNAPQGALVPVCPGCQATNLGPIDLQREPSEKPA
jgi:hypothetical protein